MNFLGGHRYVWNGLGLALEFLVQACGVFNQAADIRPNLPPSTTKIASETTRFKLYRYPLHGLAPAAIAPLDMFERGVNDLVVANRGSSTISFYRNRGNGTFEFYRELNSCAGGDSVTGERLTGGGHYDVLVTCNAVSTVSLFAGDGRGNFTRKDILVGGGVIGAQSAPHGESAKTEYLAVLYDSPASLGLFYNHGNGRFVHERELPISAAPTQFLADTFTENQAISYAVVSSAESKLSVFLRRGSTFERRDYDAPEAAGSIATLDLKGTGYNNLIVGSSTQGKFRIFENDRTGHFPTSRDFEVPGGAPSGFGTSHLRGVPQPELITQSSISGDIVIYPHLGNGNLGKPEVIHAGSSLTGLVTGNFYHHSDDMDAAMIDTLSSELVILLNDRADY